MVFCSGQIVMVARVSADLWQSIAFNPQRLSIDDILHLLFWLPLHQLRRLALCLFSFLCIPYNSPRHRRYVILSDDQSSSSSSSSSDDSDSDYGGPHSD